MSNKRWGSEDILGYIASIYAHNRGCAGQASIVSFYDPPFRIKRGLVGALLAKVKCQMRYTMLGSIVTRPTSHHI
jgi:hypothetical protein